ncbi:hypothetical protein Pan97_03720 [Bremerella volcania]|uniref:Transmembrane protein n=1 Tax=Bremerella volcania TaxID=2527984 RepID=A0A518C2E4_9BACT|nr:hypothetical protein [Bremerella volcania]QDU73401.1 hypothetical protein Pan97_03720 [Bremerella volcania]
MEADQDEALSSTAFPADDAASTDPYDLEATKWLVPAALVLFAMLLLEIVVLLAWRTPGEEHGIFIRFGQAGIAGFYLACGWAKWWVRWLVAFGAVVAFSITMIQQIDPVAYVMFGVLIMLSAGFTYLVRMIVAVIRGESSSSQRFTIFGLMLVTGIAAVCAVAMSNLPEFQEPARGASIVIMMACFGLCLITQCSPLWTTSQRQAIPFVASAVSLALLMPFAICLVFYLIQDQMPPIWNVVSACWLMAFTTWVTLYPLVFVFYGMGGSLVDPSWKLKPRYERPHRPARIEAEVDVLMSDPGDGN